MSKLDADEMTVLRMMAEYDLKPGQLLLLGPLSVAYLKGDVVKCPWLYDARRYPPPGGKLLPDKYIIEKKEWNQ